MTLDTLATDLSEAERLAKETTSARLQGVLAREIALLRDEVEAAKAKATETAAAAAAAASAGAGSGPAGPTRKTVLRREFPSYSWDQTEKTLKFRASFPDGWACSEGSQDVSKADDDNVIVEFATDKGIITLRVENLQKPVEADKLQFKFKPGYVLVTVPKRTWGTWIELRNKDKATIDKKVDEAPDKTLMTMMKNLYDDGDDEMKRTISEAMRQSRMNPE
ncbi:hypothetical protein DIPPA_22343 [Diplonema papillatum]|nr:hypothetical protein DIPPA_22343 [Diplonema papillatum]